MHLGQLEGVIFICTFAGTLLLKMNYFPTWKSNYNYKLASSRTSKLPRSLWLNINEINCSWPELRLLDPPGPVTALLSKPGSGNTWVRHLLQLATGIQTGAKYMDNTLKKDGFPGEGITNGSVVAVKTHEFNTISDRYVAILRHPLHAGLAEFNRQHSGHTGHSNMSEFASRPWHDFIMVNYINGFISNMAKLAGIEDGKICILQYEKLVEDVVSELRPCVEFLGFHIDERLAKCIEIHSAGSFHRPPLSKKDLDAIFRKSFTIEELRHIDSIYSKFLAAFGKI